MKKIILAFDGEHFSEGAFAFAEKLNEIEPILLIGVFLPQATLSNLWTYSDSVGANIFPVMEKGIDQVILQNVAKFERKCTQNAIEFRIHDDGYELTLPALEKESCYADLLIMGSEVFYNQMGTSTPNEYLTEALHSVKCPVLLVPEKYDFPESVFLAYDGSENAVFAIKQFAYLFEGFKDKETLLVYAHDDPAHDFPNRSQIEELVARHFSNLTLFKLDINPQKYFSTWVTNKKSAMLVCGSYGRSGFSQLFRKSFIKDVIAAHRLPVFVAHK
jgi:nucleotide-binding universal stress UspA family protein